MEKSILITGCSSGIGKASAVYLKEKGYRVFATARKPQDVLALQQEGFESFLLDVRDEQEIKSTVDAVLEATGGALFALVNNAGYAQPGALEDIDRNSLRNQFETNVFGLQDLTNRVLPVFRKQGFGRIIHIGSILGLISLPFRGAYNASKYAVEGLADTLRLELRDTGIFVTLIEPGPIKTNFRDNAVSAYKENVKAEESVFTLKYQRFLKRFLHNKDRLLFSADPTIVAKKIFSALESSHPKARYFVTPPTYAFATLKRILPQRILDLILANIANQEIN